MEPHPEIGHERVLPGRVTVGYATSHDSGMAVLGTESGEILFAASTERLSRVKNEEGSPLPLMVWAEHVLGFPLTRLKRLSILDDSVYSPDNGFHALHKIGGLYHRWTSSKASLPLDPPVDAEAVVIDLVPEGYCNRSAQAAVFINGKRVGRISNRKSSWSVRAPAPGREPIRRIEIVAERPFTAPPDPSTLGILVSGVSLICPAVPSHAHAVAETDVASALPALLRKQFRYLPGKRLRAHSLRKLFGHLLWYARIAAAGYRTSAEWSMQTRMKTGASGMLTMDARYDHHLCHAASAYFPGGMQKALVVTLDGVGDWLSSRVLRGENGILTPLAQYYAEEAPTGFNYELVTAMLGFHPLRHAGKVTGLAAFGQDNPRCESALSDFLAGVWRSHRRNGWGYEDLLRVRPEVQRPRFEWLRNRVFGEFSNEDIAHAIQKRTEDEVCRLIGSHMRQQPDIENVALAGGVFGNVKVNQRIKALGFKNIFIQPAMSDAGLCLGASLLEVCRQNGGRLQPYRLRHVFLGPGFTEQEIWRDISRAGLKADILTEEEVVEAAAQYLARGKVVAHFHGRMEFGPRALGNRSILYSAGDPSVNTWLNHRLNRTEFMPFAPAVLAEHAHEYFTGLSGAEHAAEFMTITFDCTEKARREIPAAVHVDGTARPQLVTQHSNPRFYGILSAYHRLAGIPACINTSFNMHEEPIVATPEDAIRAFRLGRLDILVLQNYLVTRAAE